jgi:hypothetical protein
MRLFLVLPTSLPISNALLIANVKALLPSLLKIKDRQLIVVTDSPNIDFLLDGKDVEALGIQTIQEASVCIKQVTNALVLHFGAPLNWAKGFPQYFIPLFDASIHDAQSIIQRYFTKRKINNFLSNATKILAINDWALSILQTHYPQWNSKIQLLSYALPTIPAFEWQALAATKANLTTDNNYFLVFAPIEKLVPILKEFSIFKKWQQTTMHLVFVFDSSEQIQLALAQLKGYKFKDAIALHSLDEVQLSWLAATYAILWEGVSYAHAIWMQQAMQLEIPLWMDDKLQLPKTWLEAGEVFSFDEKSALSNHFKLYYKDELYRQSKAKAGKEWLNALCMQDTATDLFK